MSASAAYAIECDGEIDVRTVSPTERAAKINWLVVWCSVPIFNTTADEFIERAFEAFATREKAKCVMVTIERKVT